MKIEYYPKKKTIEAFAEDNDLVMEVYDRGPHRLRPQYYACFEGAEIKEGSSLVGVFGDGVSPEAAIRAYAKEISGKLLVVGAWSTNRREIRVPVLEVK